MSSQPPANIDMSAVIQILTATLQALATTQLNNLEHKQLTDAASAIEILKVRVYDVVYVFTLQNNYEKGHITPEIAGKLYTLASQCATKDFRGAQRTHMDLGSLDWNLTKEWLKGIRNLVTLALVKGGATGGMVQRM